MKFICHLDFDVVPALFHPKNCAFYSVCFDHVVWSPTLPPRQRDAATPLHHVVAIARQALRKEDSSICYMPLPKRGKEAILDFRNILNPSVYFEWL